VHRKYGHSGTTSWAKRAQFCKVSEVAKVTQVRQQTRLRRCKTVGGHRTDFTSIYILAYNQSYILVYIIQVYIRTAWNDFYDHSQNNALALVSLTDLRLKYQQLLFGLTTFCLLKRVQSWRYLGIQVPKYLSTQVPKYPGTQVEGNSMQGHLPQIHSCHS